MEDFFKDIRSKRYISTKTFGFFSRVLVVFFVSLTFSLFFSCSNVGLDIEDIHHNIVFEFADDTNPPTMRLSVFVETSGDERRVESLKIVHESSGLEWLCKNPRKISGNGNSVWAGYTNFVPPSDDVFPQGRYTFYYTDMAGEICESSFMLSYPNTLVQTTANQLESSYSGIEKCVALYDERGDLLYFGPRLEGWGSDSDIKQSYGLATKIRVCYRLNRESVVCMLEQKDL